eukprot:CAMPEP_0194265940 /NCGR_PEP_ID=MMETSP0169-20130528/1005_1 /TAXON_ID=218684 /ORGANISM="Corethron pennatum, Strain L29A3" /LENGTH=707 /DNA_ID=CAMNT_0039006511 /DNA_START=26 /DNA_END=2149 /DNA_ORIENTATION=-
MCKNSHLRPVCALMKTGRPRFLSVLLLLALPSHQVGIYHRSLTVASALSFVPVRAVASERTRKFRDSPVLTSYRSVRTALSVSFDQNDPPHQHASRGDDGEPPKKRQKGRNRPGRNRARMEPFDEQLWKEVSRRKTAGGTSEGTSANNSVVGGEAKLQPDPHDPLDLPDGIPGPQATVSRPGHDYTTIDPTLEVLFIDPATVELAPSHLPELNDYKMDMKSQHSSNPRVGAASEGMQAEYFVPMFRSSANYLAKYRNTSMVLHIPGDLLKHDGFDRMIDDVALMWLLGVNLVIVIGCRNLNTSRLSSKGGTNKTVNGIRVTSWDTLRVVKEEAGFARFEVERQLARALRNGSHLVERGGGGNVVSGNFFSAQPIGVLEGIDYEYTGMLRRVEVEKIKAAHNANDVVVLTTLGVSPSGEMFSVNSECLASGVASAMIASKLVFLSETGTTLRHVDTSKPFQSLRLADAKRLLKYNGIQLIGNYALKYDQAKEHPSGVTSVLRKIAWSLPALEKGVKRAHIVPPTDGGLLLELYTRDGSGMLISRDLYDGIRRAVVEDIPGIYTVIKPLIDANVLVDRAVNVMEKEIDSYYVFIRDDLVVGCGQVKIFQGKYAEIGCLVVAREYRKGGRGDALLGYLERLCYRAGVKNIFVLSTQTMQWFLERGFTEVGVNALPLVRQATYNYKRKSKIYMKALESERALDAEELMWDR